MARITVEDCLSKNVNLFQLVLIASRRARQIYSGAEPRVPEDGDKPTVIALREIALGEVGPEILDEKVMPELDLTELEAPVEDPPPLAQSF